MKTCTLDKCEYEVLARGYCKTHYRRVLKDGNPGGLVDARSPVEKFWSRVEKTATCWIWTAGKSDNGYGKATMGGKPHYAHRLAWELVNGQIPEDKVIDHKCHNRACVNPDHLQVTGVKQNLENQGVLRRDNTSGYRGVSWDSRLKRWRVVVTNNQKGIYGGIFVDAEDANQAAIALRNKIFTNNLKDKKAA